MNAIASLKLYDGPDGKKYTHNEIRGKHHPKIGEPYLDTGDKVCFAKHGGPYPYRPILRLATPEEIAGKTAGVRLSPESVGKAYRNGFGQKVVLSWDNDGSDFEYCAVEIDGKPTFHAYGNNGMSCLRDRRYDLISEWDEKAEAGVTPEGAATPNACTAKKAASAPPAQPAIPYDAAGFYQWMWGYPQPFEVGLKPEPVRVPCACCGGGGEARRKIYSQTGAVAEQRDHVCCPECQGSGEQAGR